MEMGTVLVHRWKIIDGYLMVVRGSHVDVGLLKMMRRRREPALLGNYLGCGLIHEVGCILMEVYLGWMDVLHISILDLRGIGKFDCMLSLGHFMWTRLLYYLRVIGKCDMLSFHLVIFSHFLEMAFCGNFFLTVLDVPQVGTNPGIQIQHPNSLAIIAFLGVGIGPPLRLEGTRWPRDTIMIEAGKTA